MNENQKPKNPLAVPPLVLPPSNITSKKRPPNLTLTRPPLQPISSVTVPAQEKNIYPVDPEVQAMVAPLQEYTPAAICAALTQREIDWLGQGTQCEWTVLAQGGNSGYPVYECVTERRGTLVAKRMRMAEGTKYGFTMERQALKHAASMQHKAAKHGLAPAVRMVRELPDGRGVVLVMDKTPATYRGLTAEDLQVPAIRARVDDATKRLCSLGIVHNDLDSHLGNILVDKDTHNIIFIDFDHARLKKDDADCERDVVRTKLF